MHRWVKVMMFISAFNHIFSNSLKASFVASFFPLSVSAEPVPFLLKINGQLTVHG